MDDFFPETLLILSGNIDDTGKNVGMIPVDEDCLRKKFQFPEKKIQKIGTGFITPVVIDQVKVVDIRHQESVLFIPAAVG